MTIKLDRSGSSEKPEGGAMDQVEMSQAYIGPPSVLLIDPEKPERLA